MRLNDSDGCKSRFKGDGGIEKYRRVLGVHFMLDGLLAKRAGASRGSLRVFRCYW
jgi:hypothetical protein